MDRLLSSSPLTLEELFTLNRGQLRMITTAPEIVTLLVQENYRSLGWRNDPKAQCNQINTHTFEQVYSNESGSYCIYVNRLSKEFYCLDMGD